MIRLNCPENFDGNAFLSITSYPARVEGNEVTNCPDDMTQEQLDSMAIDMRAVLIDTIFNAVDKHMENAWPRNERERMAGWRMDGKALTEIDSTIAWADLVWDNYTSTAQQVAAGDLTAEMPPIPPRPYTWIQTKAAATA
jgi:hypothetical protein